MDVLQSSSASNRWKKGNIQVIDDLKCITESDIIVLGLETSYLHTKNGWMVTGPSLLELAEGTPAHALAGAEE